MYNTEVVNPYAGSEDVLSFGLLGRTQWVNFEGAPKTGTFTVNSPIGALDNMGLGLSIVHDEIGPSVESISQSITLTELMFSESGKVSLG